MAHMMIIYKAVNRINGKVYIGQTVQGLEGRIAEHLVDKRRNGPFPSALRKYGLQSFEFSIIDNASSKEILDAKEKYWIRQYNCKVPNGYNLTDGGEGTCGRHISAETHKKLSEAMTGEKHPGFGKTGYWAGKKNPDFAARMKLKVGEKNPNYKHGKYCEVSV